MVSPLQHHAPSWARRGLTATLAAGIALFVIGPVAAFAGTASVRPATVVSHHGGWSPRPVSSPTGISIGGKVVSLGNGIVVVQDPQGFWRTINLEPTTTYTEGPIPVAPAASAADIAVGSQIVATGTVATDHTSLDASAVRIELSSVGGTVSSITSTTIVLATSNGSATLDVSPSTVVFSRSGTVALASVQVGNSVRGFGVLQPSGALLTLYLGVVANNQPVTQSFDQLTDFHTSLPNRYCPNHYAGHGFRH